jgi:hypothetical protein
MRHARLDVAGLDEAVDLVARRRPSDVQKFVRNVPCPA